MTDAENEIPEELDFSRLRVHTMGHARKSFRGIPNPDYIAPTPTATITLEPDVAAVYPDAESVNNALRRLIEAEKEKRRSLYKQQVSF